MKAEKDRKRNINPRNQINWTDEALAASILIFTIVLIVTHGPGFALWLYN